MELRACAERGWRRFRQGHRFRGTALAERLRRQYCFFGQLVRLVTDDARLATVLDAIYHRQLAPGQGIAPPALTVTVSASAGRIRVGGRTVRLPHQAQLAHYAHLILVNAAAALAPVTVLHAGAVARAGRASLLVGSSGWGKTTLTLALLQRGWSLLSDDFAVLHPTGTVEPFLRRVGLTDDSLGLLKLTRGETELRLVTPGGGAKWLLDIETLFPGQLSDAVPLSAIFLLSTPAADPCPAPTWQLQLDHLPDGLATCLAGIPGVDSVSVRQGADPPVLQVATRPGAGVVAALDACCAERDVTILAARRGRASRPFQGRPHLSPLPAADALPAVLRHALSLSGRRFLFGTSLRQVMVELARLHRALSTTDAAIYHLVPGPPDATAAAVDRLAQQGSPAPAAEPTRGSQEGSA